MVGRQVLALVVGVRVPVPQLKGAKISPPFFIGLVLLIFQPKLFLLLPCDTHHTLLINNYKY